MTDYWHKIEKNSKSIWPRKRRKAELRLLSRYDAAVGIANDNGAPLPEWPDIKMTPEEYLEHNRKELAKWIAS